MATTKGNYKGAYADFDDDDYTRNDVRSQKTGGSVRAKLPPDKHPDKYETLKRLEREKKAMQKKYLDEEYYGKQKRQVKPKKRENTNWIKQYEYGLLDEDDFSDY